VTNGTLTIQGELVALGDIAALIAQHYPQGITTQVASTASWQGWTVAHAKSVCDAVSSETHQTLEIVVEHGGTVEDSVVRTALGRESLRGRITSGLTRQMNGLVKAGTLPAGLPKPLGAKYTSNSFQKTQGLAMPAELVPIFREALKQ
jgi:hypothetical protein